VISGSVRLAAGPGLTNRFVIDQHFRQRDRLGRLITALAYNPFAVGIGLDEDTAAFIGPDETLEVEGTGWGHGRRCSRRDLLVDRQRDRGAARLHAGLKVHILVAGATFNLHTRQASARGLLQTKQ
jgi:cyanophycinase